MDKRGSDEFAGHVLMGCDVRCVMETGESELIASDTVTVERTGGLSGVVEADFGAVELEEPSKTERIDWYCSECGDAGSLAPHAKTMVGNGSAVTVTVEVELRA